jgi:ferredoxin
MLLRMEDDGFSTSRKEVAGQMGKSEEKGGLRGRIHSWIGGRAGKKADRTYRARFLTQGIFAALTLLLGIQLSRFYLGALGGQQPLPVRPPGTEAFLPISGIMGVMDWIHQGSLNRIHPAATVLVLIALVMAFFLRKAFCSWVCPVGFFSELLARFGRWSFGRNFRPWKWIDIPLRSLKYFLMAFFVGAVLTMSADALQAFIQSPYNRVAEVKMGLFFLDLTRTGTLVIGGLVLASIFIQGAWCRYLCPYGALLGLFSWFSPARITRVADSCVDCGLCDKGCMARLPISSSQCITSPECTGCLDCLAICPRQGALELRVLKRRSVSPLAFAGAVAILFAAGYLGARVMGVWENGIPDQEYVERLQNIRSGAYTHPGGN